MSRTFGHSWFVPHRSGEQCFHRARSLQMMRFRNGSRRHRSISCRSAVSQLASVRRAAGDAVSAEVTDAGCGCCWTVRSRGFATCAARSLSCPSCCRRLSLSGCAGAGDAGISGAGGDSGSGPVLLDSVSAPGLAPTAGGALSAPVAGVSCTGSLAAAPAGAEDTASDSGSSAMGG